MRLVNAEATGHAQMAGVLTPLILLSLYICSRSAIADPSDNKLRSPPAPPARIDAAGLRSSRLYTTALCVDRCCWSD